jgi:hypothetical protein
MTGFERSRGLGTRLSSILPSEGEVRGQAGGGVRAVIPEPGLAPGSETGDDAAAAPREGERRLRDDQLAFLCLDLLQRALSLDLCAQLYRREGKALQAQVRAAPTLLAGGPDELELAEALQALFDSGDGEAVVGGVRCITLPSAGPGWRSLHVVGRRSGDLVPQERALAEQACRVFAESVHRFH